jgi:hypothetical protein
MIKRRDMWQPCQNSPQVVQTRLAEVRPKIQTRDVLLQVFYFFFKENSADANGGRGKLMMRYAEEQQITDDSGENI